MLSNGRRIVSIGHGIEYASGLNPVDYPKSSLTDVDLASRICMALLLRNRGELLHHAKPSLKSLGTKHAEEVIVMPNV